MMMMSTASSSCSGLQCPVSSAVVLGFRFLVVTRKMGAGKDGMALSFVELPELMHHLSCSSSSPSLPPPALLCFAVSCAINANVLSPCCLPADLTCGLLRAADHGPAVSRADAPSRVLLFFATCHHPLACPPGHLRRRASTNESNSFICNASQ